MRRRFDSRPSPPRWGVVLAVVATGCSLPRETVRVDVDVPLELSTSSEQVAVEPRVAEVRRTTRRGALTLELKRDAGKVTVSLPGACPARIDTRELAPGAELRLSSLFDVGPTERVVGLGRRFEVTATPRCHEAEGLATRLEHAGGAALEDVRAEARSFTATTRSDLPPGLAAHGIVPISARVAESVRSTLRFRVDLPSGQRIERLLGVSAVTRSSGLRDVGIHHSVLLSGEGWRLRAKPRGSTAELRPVGDLYELRPDAPGRYGLEDARGRTLSLSSARYDRVAMDCGHADCHAELAESAATSPMTLTLASNLGGCHTLSEPECATACHTTGELGVSDGGFADVMSASGLTKLPAEHEDLPRALQRLGGVGCLACHGPVGPTDAARRSALLETHVCAVCHDAPPRYGHVQALGSSRMGHAARTPATRHEPCARCHTTWGALGRPSPANVDEGTGLGCVTCHDVHPHGAPPDELVAAVSQHGLLRRLPLPPGADALPPSLLGVSRVCVSCHAPSGGSGAPEASSVALVAGRGGVLPTTGAPLELPPPHAATPRGCLTCHDSGPPDLVMGKSHGFRATEAACGRCHDAPPPRDPSIQARARDLLSRLAPELARAEPSAPRHALPPPSGLTEVRARAVRNVLLVLEDAAADVHHPGYARALLDAAAATSP